MRGGTQIEWQSSIKEWGIAGNEIHIWRVNFPNLLSIVPELQKILDTDERAKAKRFHFDKDRSRYVISHASTRVILGDYTHNTPGKLRFSINEFGKPEMQDSPLHFNLSHSGDFALIAVSPLAPIGVDIERIESKRAELNLAKRFFSPAEVEQLEQLNREQYTNGFFNAWTRKEAYIKARGGGLSIPLDGFSVSLKPGEKAQLLKDELQEDAPKKWSILEIQVDENHAGALAIETKQFELKFFDWSGPN